MLLCVGRALPPAAERAGRTSPNARSPTCSATARSSRRTTARSRPWLELAERIGITPTQLNRVCRQVLGHSALDVLHARLALEAQRDLAYTTMSVKQIGLDLGFDDAAYFTRFFPPPPAPRRPLARRGDDRAHVNIGAWVSCLHRSRTAERCCWPARWRVSPCGRRTRRPAAILGTWLTDDGASKVEVTARQGGRRQQHLWGQDRLAEGAPA